jgi:hypothetical protein
MQQMEQGQGADEEVAAKQYDRLQQAQELAVAKVQPLHVNLPRRGLRFVFAQPLQTEVGQPMTVTFRAVNVRGVSVPLGLAVAAAGFAALWAVAFLAVRRRRA